MARRTKQSTEEVLTELTQSMEQEYAAPPVPKPKKKPEPVFTFDRYFATLGKPVHWKAGMQAFLTARSLKGKKTIAEWNRLFSNY